MQVSTYFKGHKGLVNSREDNFKTFNLFIPSKSQGRVAMERYFVASARFFLAEMLILKHMGVLNLKLFFWFGPMASLHNLTKFHFLYR